MEYSRLYQLLIMFRRGERVADFNIRGAGKKATPKEIDELVNMGYLVHVSETSLGDKQYMITEKGRNARDRR